MNDDIEQNPGYGSAFKKQNRIKAKSAPFREHWCHRCDGNIVSSGARCNLCGYRDESKRLKNFALKE